MARRPDPPRKKSWKPPDGERRDLLLLAEAAAAVVLLWVALFGWSAGEYIAGGDALGLDLNLYTQFLREGGVWQNVVYRSGILGGANLHDVWGSNLYYLLAARLGLPAKECFNSFIFVTQIAIAFFGVRSLRPGHALWDALRAVLFAFSPFLALRFAQGHSGLVMIMTLFSSTFFLLHDLRRRQVTLTSLGVYAAILLFSLGQQNYQFIFYSLLFGGPFLAVALVGGFPAKGERSRLAAFALFVVACVLISAPRILGQFDYALGPDSVRTGAGANVIYSYTTATATDWLSSVFWGLELLPTGRDHFLFHETNTPMGPFLVLAGLLVARRRFALPVAAVVSLLLAIPFSMNLEPLSGWLADAVPPLKDFRVPERAVLPFLVLLPWMALRGIDEACFEGGETPGRKDVLSWASLAFLAVSVGVYNAPKLPREILAWAAAGGVALLAGRPTLLPKLPRKKAVICAAMVLAAAELSAFGERLAPFQTDEQVLAPLEQRKEALLAQTGERLLRPLTRSHFEYRLNAVTNKGGVMGISTIEGYTHPTRRFSQLLFALKERPVNPTAVNFQKWHVGTDFFRVYERLYNIAFLFRSKGARVIDLKDGFGEAWFSGEVEYVGDFQELARSIRSRLDRRQLKIVRSDPQAPEWTSPGFPAACAEGRIGAVDARHGGQEIGIEVTTPADCPLTVSTNFVTRVRARATLASGGTKPLEPFPGYGALLSVVVPAGATRVEIEFPAYETAPGEAAFFAGLLLLAASIALFRRSRRTPGPAEKAADGVRAVPSGRK